MKNTGVKKVMHKVGMTQIPENALLDGVVRSMEGREMFVDADSTNTERIYSGDVFEAILGEDAQLDKGHLMKLNKKTLHQLEELAKLVGTEYVQITNI